MSRILTCFFILSFAVVVGCKKAKEKKTGTPVKANLEFANGTGLQLTDGDCADDEMTGCWSPTEYGMKILNVSISPDAEGAKSAAGGLIWNNDACETATGTHTEDNGELIWEYDYQVEGCNDDDVDDFFNLARDTDKVNEELNSQKYRILPGTYNYVQMTFCIGSSKSKNAIFKADGMDEAYEVVQGTCGITSVKADPAIVVKEGESVTVALNYDLTNVIYDYGSPSPDEDLCWQSDDKTKTRCFGSPNSLEPSFVVE